MQSGFQPLGEPERKDGRGKGREGAVTRSHFAVDSGRHPWKGAVSGAGQDARHGKRNMKKHFWAILLAVLAAVLGVAVASATGDGDESADGTADNVLAVTLANAEQRTHDEIKSIVEAVIETEYCGTAMMNGINSTTALYGESPIAGVGFVRLEEEEWRPVLLPWHVKNSRNAKTQ